MEFITLIYSVARNLTVGIDWAFFSSNVLFSGLNKPISKLWSSRHECSSLMR
jgi:hypothetical protein